MTTYALTIERVTGCGRPARARPGPGLIGGAYGYVNWNWLFINLVWLNEAARGGGHGRRLILALEQAARERGCTHAHLDTFSFQARPFYEKLGYEVFSTLDDYPPGHQRFFMKKVLAP